MIAWLHRIHIPRPVQREIVVTVLILIALALIRLPAIGHANTITILYDGRRMTGTPDTQEFVYLANPLTQASQTFDSGVTTLNTLPNTTDQAGYFAQPTISNAMPALDRTSGYTVEVTVQILSEEHAGSDRNDDTLDDRAGFSIIVLSDDLQGIELGFWEDRIWAQSSEFFQVEGEPFDTTAGLIPYTLTIQGDRYNLSSNGVAILSGPLRDYSNFGAPYDTANFVFLGDNTTSASANMQLARVAIETITQPPTATATATGTPMHTPTPQPVVDSNRVYIPILTR